MNECNYIVMGEENQNTQICHYGCLLGKKNSNSEGILTIRRVYQLNSSEFKELSLAYPKWRDTCLSLALAKMLRRRFAKLPVDEAGHKKALDFVVESLINHTCSDQSIQREATDGEKNRTERVFNIIQTELQIVYDFLHIKVASFEYFQGYTYNNFIWAVQIVVFSIIVYRIKNVVLFLVEHEAYSHCVFHVSGHDYHVGAIFISLDAIITMNLGYSWLYIVLFSDGLKGQHKNCWDTIKAVKAYFKDPAKWKSNYNSLKASWSRNLGDYIFEGLRKLCWLLSEEIFFPRGKGVKEAGIYSSVLDLEAETILYCIKVDGSTLARQPKWIRRIIPRSPPTVVHSTDAKQAIIDSFKRSVDPIGKQAVEKFDQESVLTNGETTLKEHGMQHLNWACAPNGSTTVGILIWHIATTLFHHQQNNDSPQEPAPQQNDPHQEAATQENNNSRHQPTPQQNNEPHQEPAAQQNNDPFREEEVALALSSYCHYLVKYLPELLPDAVDWTEDRYEFVMKDIIEIALFTKKDRCDYALMAMWDQSSLFGLGVRLAKELMNCFEQGIQVRKMLAEFWAEMILFVAPSDNVEGHQQILEREELLTQLWALLTHAGIVTRREQTMIPTDPIESNVSNAVENV